MILLGIADLHANSRRRGSADFTPDNWLLRYPAISITNGVVNLLHAVGACSSCSCSHPSANHPSNATDQPSS
jgi:hypothetical protein